MLRLPLAIAILGGFSLLGIVVDRAILVRRRRQDNELGAKNSIVPMVGVEHVKLGKSIGKKLVIFYKLGSQFQKGRF
ncbi:hypothetical protein Cha6605_4026 [Chamaesiphon minutus PCC 6605]|uniref:Uncharacterized protein n=2 Tax=Chamaesiphon TaxID=217161 RepID=K9UJZ4_CHAP6|nr:hypothetical protein Cha6605_4026 [Chamaesiphon minutus PCC 6605]